MIQLLRVAPAARNCRGCPWTRCGNKAVERATPGMPTRRGCASEIEKLLDTVTQISEVMLAGGQRAPKRTAERRASRDKWSMLGRMQGSIQAMPLHGLGGDGERMNWGRRCSRTLPRVCCCLLARNRSSSAGGRPDPTCASAPCSVRIGRRPTAHNLRLLYRRRGRGVPEEFDVYWSHEIWMLQHTVGLLRGEDSVDATGLEYEMVSGRARHHSRECCRKSG
jgi:hypothetical protein